MRDGLSTSKAAARVAKSLGVEAKTVHNLAERFEEGGGVIMTKDGAERGPRGDSLLPETQNQIELWIQALHAKGAAVVSSDVARWLRSDPETNAGPGEGGDIEGSSAAGTSIAEYDVGREAIVVSDSTVRRWLRKMGY